MSLEIEVKYLDVEHSSLRERLTALNAEAQGRWFEANAVFDDDARSLKAKGVLLRLREKSSRFILTLKHATDGPASTTAKICEESETDVLDPVALREILAGLGFTPVLRYEKIREKWRLSESEICLDTLPFGSFVEIEGPEADIAACAKALNLPADKASTATYHDLNRQWREKQGQEPNETFVFADADKARLLARRATD